MPLTDVLMSTGCKQMAIILVLSLATGFGWFTKPAQKAWSEGSL